MLLRAIDVKKTYDGNIEALRGVNLAINKGEFVSIIGASGSGKSTLLSVIGGIERPTSGKIILDGLDIATFDDNQLAKLLRTRYGFVFQFFNLAPYLTAEENIMLPIYFGGKPLSMYKEKLEELLSVLDIAHLRNKIPQKLSGGEQQRVAIARSLIYGPEIVMLDEPTGNLDSKNGAQLMSLLHQINLDMATTIIQVTHNTEYAKNTRIINIKDGLIDNNQQSVDECG